MAGIVRVAVAQESWLHGLPARLCAVGLCLDDSSVVKVENIRRYQCAIFSTYNDIAVALRSSCKQDRIMWHLTCLLLRLIPLLCLLVLERVICQTNKAAMQANTFFLHARKKIDNQKSKVLPFSSTSNVSAVSAGSKKQHQLVQLGAHWLDRPLVGVREWTFVRPFWLHLEPLPEILWLWILLTLSTHNVTTFNLFHILCRWRCRAQHDSLKAELHRNAYPNPCRPH